MFQDLLYDIDIGNRGDRRWLGADIYDVLASVVVRVYRDQKAEESLRDFENAWGQFQNHPTPRSSNFN